MHAPDSEGLWVLSPAYFAETVHSPSSSRSGCSCAVHLPSAPTVTVCVTERPGGTGWPGSPGSSVGSGLPRRSGACPNARNVTSTFAPAGAPPSVPLTTIGSVIWLTFGQSCVSVVGVCSGAVGGGGGTV